MLSGKLAVLQAPMFDGLSLDPFTLVDDGFCPSEVGIGGCDVAQALVVTPVVVVLDERHDLGLKIAGQELVFQQDAVLQGLVPALDLGLGLGMERGVGIAAIQLAKAAGATVIATAFDEPRAQALTQFGADHGIAYNEMDIAEAVLAITNGKGADLVVDLAGGTSLADILKAVAYRGRLAIVGFSSGETPSLSFWDLVTKNLTAYGILFGLEMPTPRAHAMIDRHMQAASLGQITMPIDRIFSLRGIVDAHEYAESRRPLGRVIVVP